MASTLAANGNSTIPASVNIVHGTHPQLVAFLVLNIWPSHFGIPALLAIIMLSKGIQRHPTFLNLCFTFILGGISSSLLAYAGKTTGPEPSPILCLLQASLLYGYPPMTSVAAFSLVLQMFLVIRASYLGRELQEKNHVVRLWAMLVAPYFAFFISLLGTAIIGAANPRDVSRNRRFFYCSVRSLPLTNSITLFAAVFLFATVFFEGWLVIILYKRWVVLKSKGIKMRSIDLSIPLRVLAYGLYSTIALSLNLLSIKAPESPAPDLIIATAPSVLLVIFGTQRDIITVLCFWRKGNTKPELPPNTPPKDTLAQLDKAFVLKKEKVAYPVDDIPQGQSWPRVSVV